jgi:integrase
MDDVPRTLAVVALRRGSGSGRATLRLNLPDVGKLRQAHIVDFMDWRRSHRPDGSSAETSARTVGKDRAVLSAIFSYAQELELRDGNPVQKVRAPKHDAREPVILNGGQYERLLAECEDPMLRMYVLALGETGGRCDSEVLWLRWQDIDLEEGYLKIESSKTKGRRTKSGKSRWVPITPRLRQALREHALQFRAAEYRGEASPWVFHHTRTRRHATAGQRIGNLRQGFKAAVRHAKLPEELHQHDLRHRRVVEWLSEGKPIHIVRDAMGHSTVKVTEGYDQYVKARLRQLVDQEPSDSGIRELTG